MLVVTAVVLLHSNTAAVVAGSLSATWLPVGLVKDLVGGAAAGLKLQVGQGRGWLGVHCESAAAP